MKDVQNQRDHRNIPIDKVGIKNLRYPIRVKDRRDGSQSTIASINMYVDLPQEYKGTHMSRFVEMLHLLKPEISLNKFSVLLETMKQALDAASAHIEVSFPYFIEKQAPVSGAPGLMDYDCRITGASNSSNEIDLISEVNVPHYFGMSLFQGDLRPGRPITSGGSCGYRPASRNSSGWRT